MARRRQLEGQNLANDLRRADEYIEELEVSRDVSQYLVHVDCDAFYAAVEELDRPELKNVPMAVGRGVLTTCNYHARKFGCRSGMAGFVAMKLCPNLIRLPLNFEKYSAKAHEIREILVDYDARFESASVDEAYLNITIYCEEHSMRPEDVVAQLRKEVFENTGVTISAGIAANTKIAKIASNRNKPNGQFAVANNRSAIVAFMRDLPTRKVNGVGRVFERELEAIAIKTCGDIYTHRAYLSKLFGEKAFRFLIQTYLGIGRTKVQPAEEYERKSVGTESTFREMEGKEALREKLKSTAEELERDLSRTQFKGRTLVLKVKLHTFEVLTRQIIPPKSVCTAEDLYTYSLPMLTKLEKEYPGMKLRLMGLRCTNLVSIKKSGIDFFGRTRLAVASESSPSNPAANDDDEGEWEVWPEAEFEQAARQEKEDEMNEIEQLSQEGREEVLQYHHGKDILPNPKKNDTIPKPDGVWECPICQRPQPANDQEFNSHIDLCLSRQTIKEVVQSSAPTEPSQVVSLQTLGHSQNTRRRGPKRKTVPSRVEAAFYQGMKKQRTLFNP